MSNESILIFITNMILWIIVIVGTLGVIAGLLWLADFFITWIARLLGIYPPLIEFIWNRAKYKQLIREEDYEKLKTPPTNK